MSKMAELDMYVPAIEKLLDTRFDLCCQEIADQLDIPVDYVNYVVELRWEELTKQHEMMSYAAELENFSPFDTINS
jgi:hypothetical protein